MTCEDEIRVRTPPAGSDIPKGIHGLLVRTYAQWAEVELFGDVDPALLPLEGIEMAWTTTPPCN